MESMNSTSSSSVNTYQDIENGLLSVLGNTYNIITAFNQNEDVDINKMLAINISSIEDLHHYPCKDYKFTVNINGQTFIDNDLDRAIIKQMLNYCMSKLTTEQIKNNITNCVGVIINGADITSDNETNNFTIGIQLYICDCIF